MTAIAAFEMDEHQEVPIARITGEIDLSVTAMLGDRLEAAIPDRGPGLVLDLTDVSYVDSSGLRLLLETAKRLEERDLELRVVVADDSPVATLLTTTRLYEILRVDETLAAAVAALSATSGS
jgi:anti-anti-sigma factor